MKNIIKYCTALVLVFSLLGCEEDNDVLLSLDTNFVQFRLGNATVVENSGDDVMVTAILGAPMSQDITADLTFTGDASRYTVSSSTLTIPAGETTSNTILFTPVDDDDQNGDIDITITLNSNIPTGVGGSDFRATKVVTIVDDNVPCNDYTLTITTDNFGSETYWDILDSNGDTAASGGTYSDVSGGETLTETFSLEDGCYTFRMFDFWGDDGPSYVLTCNSLTPINDSDGLGGIPNLDVSTVPSPGFRNGGSPPDYVGYSDSHDFCVNQ